MNGFADKGHLASYFVIAPRASNSNETEQTGRIHKRVTKLVRAATVQPAPIVTHCSRYLKRFFEQVNVRPGAGKAIVWPTSKDKWVLEDFPNFVLAVPS